MEPCDQIAAELLSVIARVNQQFTQTCQRFEQLNYFETVSTSVYPLSVAAPGRETFYFSLDVMLPGNYCILSFSISFRYTGEYWVIESSPLWVGGEAGWEEFDFRRMELENFKVNNLIDLVKELPYIAEKELKKFRKAVIDWVTHTGKPPV